MNGRKGKAEADGASAHGRRAPGTSRAGFLSSDTIVAIATAPGRGVIAVVCVSGPDAERVCRRVVSPSPGWPLPPRQATCCRVHASDDLATLIDDELGVHGGGYVPHAVCAALLEAGARRSTS